MSKKIHFIGIGGIGMSALAQLCLKKGYVVCGSDLKDSPQLEKLREEGAQIFIGHSRENIANDLDFVVFSSAIKPENEELQQAQRFSIPILKRAELLAMLMKEHQVIAIAGAHGKTTTSSLLSHVLIDANFSPTIAVGGIVKNLKGNACMGNGLFFVAEADESDGTFLLYKPKYSIITNIDYEHLDYYLSFDKIKKAFAKFINNHSNSGCIFWCYDDINLLEIIKSSNRKNKSFGLSKEADIYATDIELNNFSSRFKVIYQRRDLGDFNLFLTGIHNVSNALSVIGLALDLDIELKQIKKSLETFAGVERRFQIKYNKNNILIVDDYAHHPTEIRATINAARCCRPQRLIVVFQPHRYSRLKNLMSEFSRSFSEVDHLFITDIYPAGEENIYNINSAELFQMIREKNFPHVELIEKDYILKYIPQILHDGDLLLFLGAGDINRISDELVKDLQRKDKV